MKYIKTRNGHEFVVDDEDYDAVMQYKWNFYPVTCFYGMIRTTETISRSIGRFLLNPPTGMIVDHIDRNPYNNLRENLRVVTHRENNRNASKTKRQTSSKYKGVSFHKKNKNWMAYITLNYTRIYLGSFKLETEAAIAYNEACLIYFKGFGVQNVVNLT